MEDKIYLTEALAGEELFRALSLDAKLLEAEAAAGLMDGFPINSALVEDETLILK